MDNNVFRWRKMEYTLIENNGKKVVCLQKVSGAISSEADALDAVAACGENTTDLLLLPDESVPLEFFDLKTRLAGEILLKFSNYYIRCAMVASPENLSSGKFRDFMIETNRGQDFRIFSDPEKALIWLTS